MNTLSVTRARAKLYALIDEVSTSGKRMGITNKGETKAVLISPEEISSWEATLETLADQELMRAIRAGDEDIKAGRIVPWEKIKKDLGLDVPSVSKQSRRQRSKKTR